MKKQFGGQPSSGVFRDRVFILDIALSHIESIIRNHALLGDIETGGIFLGKRTSEGIIILHATDAGPDADCFHTEFSPDVAYVQKVLKSYRKEYDVYYIGSWHRHPGGYSRLSQSDLQQLHRIIDDPDMLDEFVSLIVTDVDGIKMNFFHIDKEKTLREIAVDKITSEDIRLKGLRHQKNQWVTPLKNKPGTSSIQGSRLDYSTRKVPIAAHGQNRLKAISGDSKEERDIPWYNRKEIRGRLLQEQDELKSDPFVFHVGEFEMIEGDLKIQVNSSAIPPVYFLLTEKFPECPPFLFYRDKNGEYQFFNENYSPDWDDSSSMDHILRNLIFSHEAIIMRGHKDFKLFSESNPDDNVDSMDHRKMGVDQGLRGLKIICNAFGALQNRIMSEDHRRVK
ncbi:MAG: hypothetical protein GX268_01150 [Methanomicrobiales archaeon]|nr:hypothetical protein [Methanomicrobiales archaeon]